MNRSTARPALALVAGLALLATGCSPADEETTPAPPRAAATTTATATGGASPSPSSPTGECAKESLDTVTEGKLTIATDQPVYEPWFVDNKPENGKGHEGAVAAAVARQMGFTPHEVTWIRVKFDAAIAPGPKKFDFDINEFSITEKRRKAVDFSSPYYDANQALITTGTSKAANAKSLADLKDLEIGAQVGTTSYAVIPSLTTKKPKVYNNNDDAKKALENGQVDAIVVDLPTAFYMTSAELEDGRIIGQLPSAVGGSAGEQFGLVLDKGSPLTECVSQAVDALAADGTLERLEQEWLSQAGDAPILE